MNYILFDDPSIRTFLLPLTFSRAVASVRVGILTIAEKWQHYLQQDIFFQTQPYLQQKFPLPSKSGDTVYINGAVCPTQELVNEINKLQPGQSIIKQSCVIAYCNSNSKLTQEYLPSLNIINRVWDIFRLNASEIISDFYLITNGRKSAEITDPFTHVYSPEKIFIEGGANIKAAVLNAEAGPIYIGKNAQVQEGALIRGPFALCDESILNMGAKIKGDSTIGPYCKVGGEISNSVFFGYSNKGHDGFVGNSVIGEWCNLGADTNTSNLKNNYGEVELYSYPTKALTKTGLQFCGLIMGDHSKCSINTMFNTGTVVGFNSNIFGGGFPPKFIPSFSWGGAAGFERFSLDKSYEIAQRVMERRNVAFSATDKEIFQVIFNSTFH